MEKSFEDFINVYEQHIEDPNWLSNAIIKLATILYTHNSEMALAELDESRALVRLLEQNRDGKKMAVSEAEKRAQVETNNHYHDMKVKGEAIIETINSIKQRLNVLGWERHSPQR